jgi:hypothetical protein
LTSTYEALENGGVLAFDISQPGKNARSSWWIDRKEFGKEEEVVRTIFSRPDPKTNIVSVNLFFDVYRKGILQKRFYEYGEAKLSSKEDVEKLLESVDFKHTQSIWRLRQIPTHKTKPKNNIHLQQILALAVCLPEQSLSARLLHS